MAKEKKGSFDWRLEKVRKRVNFDGRGRGPKTNLHEFCETSV